MSERIMAEMSCMPAPTYVRDSSELYSFESKSISAPSEYTWIAPFLEQTIIAIKNHPDLVITFAMLEVWGVPEDILDALRDILTNATVPNASPSPTETTVALNLILIAAKKSRTISRDDVRLLRKVVGKVQAGKDLRQKLHVS